MTPQEAPAGGSVWAVVRAAIAGSRQDYTELTIDRAIVLLAIPMVLEMFMESLFGVVDVFWVAHLGSDAITTVGLTETALTVLYAIALGLSAAATAMVARRIGEKREDEAASAAVQAILIGVILSAVTAGIGFVFSADLLRLMGASDHVVAIGTGYTRTILGGSATIFLLFLINAVFRGAGDAATAMRALWISNGINLLLNPCLIFGLGPFPHLGITGSAVGTTIGRGVGVLFQIYVLTSGRSQVAVRARDLRVDLRLIGKLLGLSGGGIFQYLVQMGSWICVVRIIATFGSAAVAANTLAIKILIFVILPSWGLSNAAATLVGQNLGAGKPDRAEYSAWRTGLINMLFLGGVGVLFIVFAGPIVALFTDDPAVLPLAARALRCFSFGNVSYAYGMVITAALNGAGDTYSPTVLNIIAFWVIEVPLAYALSLHTSLGVSGAFWSVVTGDSVLAGLGVLWFRRGTWKRRSV